MSTIKSLLKKQESAFISLRELLKQMSTEGNSTVQDAAELLRREIKRLQRKGEAVPEWHQRFSTGWDVVATYDLPSAQQMLTDFADEGDSLYEHVAEWEDGVAISGEPLDDDVGFLRSAIYDLLDNCGLKLSRAVPVVGQVKSAQPLTGVVQDFELKSMAADALEALGFSPIPDWMHPLIAMPTFQVREAACVMAGYDPLGYLNGNTGDPRVEADIARYRRLLLAAIAAGDLTGGNWSTDPTEQEVSHVELHDWCRANLQIWPIPSLKPFRTNDTEIKEKLRAAEAERDDLARQLRTAKVDIARLKSLEETPGYRDITHDRYAPKLAAAIDAWEAVTDPQGKHPKQALVQWLTKNAAKLGLWDKDRPNKTAIEEAAKVANWQERGGAPRTPG